MGAARVLITASSLVKGSNRLRYSNYGRQNLEANLREAKPNRRTLINMAKGLYYAVHVHA